MKRFSFHFLPVLIREKSGRGLWGWDGMGWGVFQPAERENWWAEGMRVSYQLADEINQSINDEVRVFLWGYYNTIQSIGTLSDWMGLKICELVNIT